MRGRSYEYRLKGVGMTTLQDSRERGDMMTSFRVMEGHDRVNKSIWFKTVEESRGAGVRTRQDISGKLVQEQLGLEFRKHFFFQRVIGLWNSLSESPRRSEPCPSTDRSCLPL